MSLSARRAWIEIVRGCFFCVKLLVALRKESVDRNPKLYQALAHVRVALRKESVDRNDAVQIIIIVVHGRSPQGERG